MTLGKVALAVFVAAVFADVPLAISAVNPNDPASSEQVLRREAAAISPRGAKHGPGRGEHRDQEILVKFRSGVSPEKKGKIHGKHGSTRIKEHSRLNVDHIRVRHGKSVEQALKSYREEADVEYAEPNFLVQAATVPNDAYYDTTGSWGQTFKDMWGLHSMRAGEAWDVTTGSADVIVAVSDTGADLSHPDLQANLWVNPGEIAGNGIDDDNNGYVDDVRGWNFIATGSSNPADDHGHGTHVSGTIAAATGNGVGIAGISWNTRIMPLKFLDSNGSGDIAAGTASILYAVANGARVINCSWGGTFFSQTLEDAIDYAVAQGVLVVAAAGNSNLDAGTFHPASAANVLTVAATDYQDKKAYFSNYGDLVEVAAPGVDILSLRASGTDIYQDGIHIVGGSYYRASGTSMAAPHVSGLAALLFSRHPEWTPTQVTTQIMGTTDDIGLPELGTGRINAAAALTQLPGIRLEILTAFDDSSGGNGNGRPDAGETVNFLVTLKNRAAPAHGVTVEVAVSDPYVTVVSGTSTVGDIGTMATASTAASPLVLRVSPDIPSYHNIVLTFTITADGGAYRKELTIQERASLYLPGWPVTATASTVSHPVVADVDGDGIPEVLMATDKVWVLKGDGTPLPGWPQPISPAYNEYGFGNTLIAVGDIDNDGSPEVVFTTYMGIYAWKSDGTPVAGFPVYPPDSATHSPNLSSLLLVDLDNDGGLEIIASSPPTEKVYAYRSDGTPVPGWPVSLQGAVAVGYWHWNMFPTAADIDGDGLPEIVASSMEKKVHAWRGDGSLVPGWPITLTETPTTVSLADVNRDGKSEVFFTTYFGNFYGYNGSGTALPGWPKSCGAASFGDMDGDGNLEIVCGGYSVNVFRSDGSSLPGWSGNSIGSKIWFAPAIGDIDGDGLSDIVARDNTDQIYAWNRNGTLLKGFPLPLNGSSPVVFRWSVESSLALADINGDGMADIIASSGQYDGRMYALRMPGAYSPATVSWPMLQGGTALRGEGARVAILTAGLADGVVGIPFIQSLAGAIGKLPFTWGVASGSLPSGLTLDPTSGVISGTPVEAGSFSFVIRLSDASGNTVTRAYAIQVRVINITTTSLPPGRSGSSYSQALSATGGVQPHTWSVTQGSLPAGLSLNSSTGTISGIPGIPGLFDFTVTATGSGGGAGTRSLSIRVYGWTDTRDSGGNEYGRGVTADSAGNVYVTGYSAAWSLRTIKYSSAGEEVWNKTYSAKDAKGIATDAAGNVYIAGSKTQGIMRCLLLKYDPAGNEVWSQTFSGGTADYCEGAAVDQAGNVFVTGTSWVNLSGVWKLRILVVKYDQAGAELWHRVYEGGTAEEIGYGVAVDAAGNAYVTGTISSSAKTAATIKYDPSGNLLWTRAFPGEGRAVAVDPDGNIVVGGYSVSGLRTTSRIVKYTPGGDTLWSRTFDVNGHDYLTSLKTDGEGNIYIAGYTSNGTNNDYFTARYGPTGRLLWQTFHDGGRDESARGVAVDPSGNVWVTGDASNGTNTDYLTVRYSQPRITQQSLPVAVSGNPFSTAVAASGGSAPYRWSVSSGDLPAGLTLDAVTGTISGTPGSTGTFTFGLRVAGSDGIAAEQLFNLVANSGPDFIGSPLSGFAPLLVQFTDISAGSPTAWAWDFGDASAGTASNPFHLYKSPGTYTVSLTATGAGGPQTKTKAGYVSVLACPNGPVRLAGAVPALFADFTGAYVQAADNDVIQLQALDFSGDLNFGRDVRITLKGGYDCGYTSSPAVAGLLGNLSVSGGTVEVENLLFK